MGLASHARREFLRKAGGALLTAGTLKSAGRRVSLAIASAGGNASGPVAERAAAAGFDIAAIRGADFRAVLADSSIDAVYVAAPSMAIDACRDGKDVYVETPPSLSPEEGLAMVQAARRYGRVVQAGTVLRSSVAFRKARRMVAGGELGDVAFCRIVQPGGGSHLLDALQFVFDEAQPLSVAVQGGSSLLAVYRYPGFVASYEAGASGSVWFHGSTATLRVHAGGYSLFRGSHVEHWRDTVDAGVQHWANFLECIRTRGKPAGDIETAVRALTGGRPA